MTAVDWAVPKTEFESGLLAAPEGETSPGVVFKSAQVCLPEMSPADDQSWL